MKSPANQKYLILACDGGGIRGLVTSLLLQQLLQYHPTFLSQTYLFAGTSTGGIISLALAAGVQPSELVDLYANNGSQIFTPSSCDPGVTSSARAAVKAAAAATPGESIWLFILEHLEEIVCVWYDNSGLQTAIQNTLGANANATLNSLTNGDQYVLVNTFQLCNSANLWTPLQLTNLPNLQGNDSGTTRVLDAAMSTSAAPMYFPPYNHPVYSYCSDGGLFANNPGTIALTTLIESGVSLEDIWMLSLSTGNTQDCYPPSTVSAINAANVAGPLFWSWPISQPDPAVAGQPYTPALPMLTALFDGTSEVDAYQCAQLLPGRFKRANVPLSQPVALNDYSAAAIQAMTNSTASYIQTSAEWADIGKWIKGNFVSGLN